MNSRLFILPLCFLIACTASVNSRKERPEGEHWMLCPLCNGFGVAEVYDSGQPSSKTKKVSKDNISCVGDVLGVLFGYKIDEVNERQRDQDTVGKSHDYPSEDDKSYPYYIYRDQQTPPVHVRKKQIPCSQCEGRGWVIAQSVRKSEGIDYEKQKVYHDLNEKINR